jgi:hypothetical protein
MAVHRCNKEVQIDDMYASIKKLNEIVVEGTNGDSLKSMVKTSIENQKSIDDKLWMVDSNIVGLMKFQTKIETERDIRQKAIERKIKRQQWLVSLLVGALIGLGGLIIALVTL